MDTFTWKGKQYPYSTNRALVGPSSRLRFDIKTPQLVEDSWRGTTRTCRFYGHCVMCGIATYAFDDGENDPRGVLGDHAADPFELAEHLAEDDGREVRRVGGVTIPACFGCTNDYDRYQSLTGLALRKARAKGADV